MKIHEELARLRAIAARKNALKILMLLRESEKVALSPSEIAAALKLEASQVYRALRVLLKYGVVDKHEHGATPAHDWVFYSLSRAGSNIAQHMADIQLALLHAVANDALNKTRRGDPDPARSGRALSAKLRAGRTATR